VREFAAAALGDEAGEGLHVGADAVPLERCREELRDDEIWSVPAFLDTGLGCQLTELPIS
jgi:hypothetical protein